MSQIQSVFKIDFLDGEFVKSMVKIGDVSNFLSKSNLKYVVLTNLRMLYVGPDFFESLQLNDVDSISLFRRKKFWRGLFWLLISLFSAIGAFLYFDNSLISFFAFLGVMFSGVYLFFDYYALNRELIFSIHSKTGELDIVVDAENYYEKTLMLAKEIAYSCPDAVYRYESQSEAVSEAV